MIVSQSQCDQGRGIFEPPKRLEALGVDLVWVDSDGSVKPHQQLGWFEQLLVESQLFRHSIQPYLEVLREQTGEPLEVLSGVWLISLAARRRRAATTDDSSPFLAAILLTQEVIDSEWLPLLCDSCEVDHQIAVGRIDRTQLVGQAEIQRLAVVLAWLVEDAAQISHQNNALTTFSLQLGDAYEELHMLHKFSLSLTVDQPPHQLLAQACQELQEVAGLRWMALQLTEEEPRLNQLAGELFVAGQPGCEPHVLKRIGVTLMMQQSGSLEPLVIGDTRAMGIPHLPRLASGMVLIPLAHNNRPIGVLFGGDKVDGSQVSSIDIKLCSSLGGSLSIFLENTMLYEDMQAMFMGTMHALTSSIDAKDRYTHGHSERVAMITKQLAIAMGLDEHQVERVYIAGLVHDVGKIGVPEAVLRKTGPLDLYEFNLIKQHPEIGARILSDIRQMQDLLPGVLYHHERWDGHGYPHQLAGESIPLFGRLIGLADAFDAMSSNRTYRRSMKHEQVLSEIRRCSGSQFDPHLGELFVKLDFEPFFEMIRLHQQTQVDRGGAVGLPG